MDKKIYAIDLDGTLTINTLKTFTDKEIFSQKPNKEMIKQVNQLFLQGNTIVIHTARPSWNFEITISWLATHGVHYHHLVLSKFVADYYVDDRNMSIKEFLLQ